MLGQAVQILCRVDASPVPSITMYRNNNVIFTTTQRVVDYQIHRVSADDDGSVFICEASNSIGTVSENVTLNVTGKSYIICLYADYLITIYCIICLYADYLVTSNVLISLAAYQ